MGAVIFFPAKTWSFEKYARDLQGQVIFSISHSNRQINCYMNIANR